MHADICVLSITPSDTSELSIHGAIAMQALMECICGLSYIGDIRMTWAEDRRKIERIVQGSWPALVNTFLPQLQVCNPIGQGGS